MLSRLIVLAFMGLSVFGASVEASPSFSGNGRKLLADILMPGAKGLMEGLWLEPQASTYPKIHVQASEPVFAYKISIGDYKGTTAHLGYYSDSMIVTIMDPTITHSEGTQIIVVGDTPVSITTNWTTEAVNGVQYVKHIHDRCFVYSNPISQFAVFK